MKRMLGVIAIVTLAACADGRELTTFASRGSVAAVEASDSGRIIPNRYVVVFHAHVRDVRELSQRVSTEHRGQVHHVYQHALRGMSLTLPEGAANALRRNPSVASIEPDRIIRATAVQSSAPWNLDRIDQRLLPLDGTYTYNRTGAGVSVYILDSGINYFHEEFAGRAFFGFDAFTDGFNGNDCNGHGSHVAGTVGGNRFGVAKNVDLVAVRVLDCTASGPNSGIIAGLDWVAANHRKPAIANMSLVSPASYALDTAVKNLIAAGVTVVAASGNNGANACNYSPGRVPEVVTVGATNAYDNAPWWSNYGSCVDLFAPGTGITSAWFDDWNSYHTTGGTSMATPLVSGVTATFLEANPTATPLQVRERLYEATTKGQVGYSSSANNHLLTSFLSDLGTNIPPVAAFAVTCSLRTCSFVDQSSDSDGQVTSWMWSMGDGTTYSSREVTHEFSAAGTYAVSLVVGDDQGATASADQTLAVFNNHPPMAAFAFSCSGLSCTFSDQSTDADGKIVTWAWDFGDGTGSAEASPSHSFGSGGTYAVSLQVTDDRGAVGQVSRTVGVAPKQILLTTAARTAKGQNLTDLAWNNAAGYQVDVYRNGVRVATTENDGFYTDLLPKQLSGTYTYKVCEASTTTCSNDATR